MDKNGLNILMGKRKGAEKSILKSLCKIEKWSFWPGMKMGKSEMFSASDETVSGIFLLDKAFVISSLSA